MKILLYNRHTPHAYMMITALYDCTFVMPFWAGTLRPIPENLVIDPNYKDSEYDVIVDDDIEMPTKNIETKRRILLLHCEHNRIQDKFLEYAFTYNDIVVLVSQHKKMTLCEYALHKKCVVIPPGFSGEQWPLRSCYNTESVVTVANGLSLQPSREIIKYIQSLSPGFDFIVLGNQNRNEYIPRVVYITPANFSDLKTLLAQQAVYVNTVVGHSFGMSPMEAMVTGLPLVTGGCSDVLYNFAFDTWNCFVSQESPLCSVSFIRDRIHWLFEHPEEADIMGKRGREVILNLFSFDTLRKNWLSVL